MNFGTTIIQRNFNCEAVDKLLIVYCGFWHKIQYDCFILKWRVVVVSKLLEKLVHRYTLIVPKEFTFTNYFTSYDCSNLYLNYKSRISMVDYRLTRT